MQASNDIHEDMVVLLTITHTLNDGSITSRNIQLDSAQPWDELVMMSRDIARDQPGVVGAQTFRFVPGQVGGLCKVFQPHEIGATPVPVQAQPKRPSRGSSPEF